MHTTHAKKHRYPDPMCRLTVVKSPGLLKGDQRFAATIVGECVVVSLAYGHRSGRSPEFEPISPRALADSHRKKGSFRRADAACCGVYGTGMGKSVAQSRAACDRKRPRVEFLSLRLARTNAPLGLCWFSQRTGGSSPCQSGR